MSEEYNQEWIEDGKVYRSYYDGSTRQVGIQNDDWSITYFAATPPRQFRSEWNQQQYLDYRTRINNAENNNGRSPEFTELLHKQSQNVLKGAGDLLARLQQEQRQALQNNGLKYSNSAIGILGMGTNMQRTGQWMYMGDSVMYIDENSMFNNINLPNSRNLEIGTKYSSKNSEVIELKDNGMYTITNLKTGKIQTFNGRYFQPPNPLSLSNIGIDEYKELRQVIKENPVLKNALDEIIKSEAGYVDDPNDLGGATKYGIAEKREWPKFAKRFGIDLDRKNIKNIELRQVELYYFESRYNRFRLKQINDRKLIIAIFDQSVLIPELINRNLKIALKKQGYNVLINDKNLTDQEIIMINNANQINLLNDFLDNCLLHYESLKNLKQYLNGWQNRVNKLR